MAAQFPVDLDLGYIARHENDKERISEHVSAGNAPLRYQVRPSRRSRSWRKLAMIFEVSACSSTVDTVLLECRERLEVVVSLRGELCL